MFLYFLFFTLVYADSPSDTEKRRIEILQEHIPKEVARKMSAEAISKEIGDFLEGKSSLFSAFPHYEGGQLLSKTYIKSRLYQLEEKQKRLLVESFSVTDSMVGKKDLKKWMTLKRQSNQQEAYNIEQERRFLLRLMVSIEENPFIQESSFNKEINRIRIERESLSEEQQEKIAGLLEREQSLFFLRKELIVLFGVLDSKSAQRIEQRYQRIDASEIDARSYSFELNILSKVFPGKGYEQRLVRVDSMLIK